MHKIDRIPNLVPQNLGKFFGFHSR